jgi:hypothetical protein
MVRIRDEPPPDHIAESLETNFWVKILKFFDADQGSGMKKFGSGMEKFGSGIREGKNSDPGSGMEKIRIWDPGWKKFGSGMEKIWIWDPG